MAVAIALPRVRVPVATAVLGAVLAAPLVATGTAAEDDGVVWRLTPGAGVVDPGIVTEGDSLQKVVVTGLQEGAVAVARAVTAVGGSVTDPLPIVNGAAAEVPADRIDDLAAQPGVRAVTADRSVQFEALSYDETSTASSFARTTGATKAWSAGNLGKGVGVAVLDTGVSPHPDFAGRLVHGPDLSGEGTYVDSYGHGTVMAGLVGGSGAASAATQSALFTGAAPESTIISVKTAGRNGVVDVSTILQGLHWVSAYREQFNIRVLNLSWGVASTQHPSVDPLNYAVQRLWGEGIVVVVAAGNSGPNSGTITKPGDDPVILTVGAYDDKQDADLSNDGIASWSSRGPTAQGLVKPDLVVPGRTVVSTRGAGSKVEADYPKAWLPPSYIKGSGTSQASAVASGVIALLLAARPELTPDQVKSILKGTATPIGTTSASTQGAGRIQLGAALTASPSLLSAQPRLATGLGSIDASRGGMRVVSDCNGVLTEIRGEIDVRCEPWNPAAWSGVTWKGDSWTGVTWKGAEWTGVTWKNLAWSDATWNGVTWKGGTWTGDSWQGASWNGSGSVSSPWVGVTWKSLWTGVTWKEASWTTGEWTSAEYEEFLTAFWGPRPPAGVRLPGEEYEDDVVSRADAARQPARPALPPTVPSALPAAAVPTAPPVVAPTASPDPVPPVVTAPSPTVAPTPVDAATAPSKTKSSSGRGGLPLPPLSSSLPLPPAEDSAGTDSLTR